MSESFGLLTLWIGILALWFVLQKWVLPHFGVKT